MKFLSGTSFSALTSLTSIALVTASPLPRFNSTASAWNNTISRDLMAREDKGGGNPWVTNNWPEWDTQECDWNLNTMCPGEAEMTTYTPKETAWLEFCEGSWYKRPCILVPVPEWGRCQELPDSNRYGDIGSSFKWFKVPPEGGHCEFWDDHDCSGKQKSWTYDGTPQWTPKHTHGRKGNIWRAFKCKTIFGDLSESGDGDYYD